MDVSPEEVQFQEQLKWCISTLELRLTTKYMSKREVEQSVKCLNIVKNKSSSYVRKRKAMRQALGDYQKAMAVEAVKGKLDFFDVQSLEISPAPSQMDVLTTSPLSDKKKKKKEDTATSQMDVLMASPVSDKTKKKKEDTATSRFDVSAETPKTKEEKPCKSNALPLPKDFFDHPVFARRPVDPKLKEWERRKEFIDGVVDSRYSSTSRDVSSDMESGPSPLAPSIRAEKSLPSCVRRKNYRGTNADYGQPESEPLEDDDDIEESAYRRDIEEFHEQSSYMNRLAALRLKLEEVRLTASKANNTKCSEKDESCSDSEFEELTKKFSDWRLKGGNMN